MSVRALLVDDEPEVETPFRETTAVIQAARAKGIIAVEIEAAALYTFARSRDAAVLCLMHVTNRMKHTAVDFEKGEGEGSRDALAMLQVVSSASSPLFKVSSDSRGDADHDKPDTGFSSIGDSTKRGGQRV